MGRTSDGARTPRFRSRHVVAIALASLILATTACDTFNYMLGNDLGEPNSVELTSVQFDDIPVPYGFRLMERLNQSLTYRDGSMRVGRLEYRGESVSPEKVAAFYRDQMPLAPNGWTLAQESLTGGQRILHFDKDTYHCTVTISKKQTNTYVRVEVDTLYES